jgi:ribose transport system substrate-binding protein
MTQTTTISHYIKIVFHSLYIRFLLVFIACAAQPTFAADNWDGPTSGPVKQPAKKVTFISQDFKNSGISAAFRGFEGAVRELGWELKLMNGDGNEETIRAAIELAIAARDDGIVLGGFAIDQKLLDLAARAKQAKIVLVGWHAAAEPGPTKELFVNVGSASAAAAKMAADFVVQNNNEKVGVVIFNDNRFAVANAKVEHMKAAVAACKRCKLLAVENILIPNAKVEIPAAVERLNQLYGKAWTHSLAINDAYFDTIKMPLISINRGDIQNVSAGDGSAKAFNRIKSGSMQQAATVAEPMNIQGWQLADELNRAFAGQAASGYISKPILVTTQLINQLNGEEIDSTIDYKRGYLSIWLGKPTK